MAVGVFLSIIRSKSPLPTEPLTPRQSRGQRCQVPGGQPNHLGRSGPEAAPKTWRTPAFRSGANDRVYFA